MKSTIRRLTFFAFLFFSPNFYLHAQSKAQLSGQVTDASGYGIASVRIIAQPQGTRLPQTYETNSTSDGTYSFSLPPGSYHVRVEHSDFVPRELTLQLAPAESRKLDLRLEIAQLSENVVVTAMFFSSSKRGGDEGVPYARVATSLSGCVFASSRAT